jgi:hypothetical protein
MATPPESYSDKKNKDLENEYPRKTGAKVSLTPEERAQQSRARWALYGQYKNLWMEVNDGEGELTYRFFAEYHHLTKKREGSEVSRWLSARGRGVKDGGPYDENIRRVLTKGIADLEAKKAARAAANKAAEDHRSFVAAAPAPKPNGRPHSTTQSPLPTH